MFGITLDSNPCYIQRDFWWHHWCFNMNSMLLWCFMATLDWPKQNLTFSLNTNWNWTRLDMYVSTAVIFVVSHVVSITLGVLRWYTEQNTQSPSYGADLLLSNCRKSESERSQSLDSSIHLNINAKLSLLNSCLPHTEAVRTLWTTAFIALLLLSKIWRHHWRNFRVVQLPGT